MISSAAAAADPGGGRVGRGGKAPVPVRPSEPSGLRSGIVGCKVFRSGDDVVVECAVARRRPRDSFAFLRAVGPTRKAWGEGRGDVDGGILPSRAARLEFPMALRSVGTAIKAPSRPMHEEAHKS